MKQDTLSEVTRKAIETPLGFTQTLLEKTTHPNFSKFSLFKLFKYFFTNVFTSA